MTEQQIISLFRDRRRYEAEYAIMRDCSDDLADAEQSSTASRYALLKRKLSLTDHWISFLPNDEQHLIKKHLVEGLPWSRIAAQMDTQQESSLSYDERTLQRVQARAITRIYAFMNDRFENTLDYLAENEE